MDILIQKMMHEDLIFSFYDFLGSGRLKIPSSHTTLKCLRTDT